MARSACCGWLPSGWQPWTRWDGERGVAVLTASIAAFEGQVGQAAYASSKAAVHGLTLCLALDLAEYQIRVCTVEPGTFWTPMLDGLDEQARHSLAVQVPHPTRLGARTSMPLGSSTSSVTRCSTARRSESTEPFARRPADP